MKQPSIQFSSQIAVFIGGAVGVSARYAISLLTPANSLWPLSTLIINLSGAFALGFLVTLLAKPISTKANRLLKAGLGIGLIGGFTTYSTFAFEAASLLTTSHTAIAALYMAVTVIGGVCLSLCGMWLASGAMKHFGARS